MMGSGQPRHDRGDQVQISFVGDGFEWSEFLLDQGGDAGCGYQLEAEPVGGDARHFLESASRLSGNSDQTHLIQPMISYPAWPSSELISEARKSQRESSNRAGGCTRHGWRRLAPPRATKFQSPKFMERSRL